MSASEALPDSAPADRSAPADVATLRVAVVGGGYMGGGIAQTFALHGFDCRVADADAERAATLVEGLRTQARRYEELGLFPAGAADRVDRHLTAAVSLTAAVRDADYVTEAVPEQPALKRTVLEHISDAAPAGAVLATNTSAIPIGELATAVRRPERFLGVHWMNPAPFVPCVEVIATDATEKSVTETVVALLVRLGKAPTRVSDSPGFVANRLQYALFKECARLVEEGVATPGQIDEVVSNSFGFRLPFFGPFAIADIAGLDVYAGGFPTLERSFGERMATPESLQRLVSDGRLGVKTGRGYHAAPDAAAVALYRDRGYAALAQLRRELGDNGLQPGTD